MLSVRTFLFGSDNGSSLSHLLKARTAKVVGICWDSQGLTVDGQTRRLDGSNLGGDGGLGWFEWVLLPSWMLNGPVAAGEWVLITGIFPNFLAQHCQLAAQLG